MHAALFPSRSRASVVSTLLISLCALLAIVSFPRPAAAQDSSALINEALDKQVELEIKNASLPAAIRSIEDKTGVPLRADPAVWDLLPWGEQTNINLIKIQNQTLRQALTAITQKLGLTYHLADQAVMLEPMAALRRLWRRSTVQELEALDLLAGKPMPALTGGQKVQDILTAIDVQLGATQSPYAIYNQLGTELRNQPVNVPRNATMLDALEAIVKQTRATWYPQGKDLIVLPKETLVRDQLSRTITARYNGSDVAQVLEDLRKRAGVDFALEPAALQKVPPEFRSVKIFWDNVPVSQALESLKASTGLDYTVTDQGISITNPSPAAMATTTTVINDPVTAMVQLDNGMQLLIRESQIPPDIRPYLQHRLQKEMDSVRAMAKQEGYPLTQPTTEPATPKK
jgi:hypothetical protein